MQCIVYWGPQRPGSEGQLLSAALLNRWAAKCSEITQIFFEKSYWLIQTAFFIEKVMKNESQKCIIVAFHPRNAPIFNPGLLLWVPQTKASAIR